MDWRPVRLLILDVDGVLTDGRISAAGDEDAKSFHVHDGCALKVWQRSGGRVAIVSGRQSADVGRRAAELNIAWVRMGVADKLAAFEALLRSAECDDRAAAFVGDDLPDLPPMRRCGFPVAVANAVPEVKRAARYVTRRCGGNGAVAETVEWILRKEQRWSPALYGTG